MATSNTAQVVGPNAPGTDAYTTFGTRMANNKMVPSGQYDANGQPIMRPATNTEYLAGTGTQAIQETGGNTTQQNLAAYQLGGNAQFAPDYYSRMTGNAAQSLQGGLTTDQYLASQGALNASLQGSNGDVNQLRNIAFGNAGPSAAEMAMRGQGETAFQQQLAAGSMARGANMAGAMSNASTQGALAQGQIAQQGGIQRAIEQAQARQQLLAATGQQQQALTAQGSLAMDSYLRERQQKESQAQFYEQMGYQAQADALRASMAQDQARVAAYLDMQKIQAGKAKDQSFFDKYGASLIQGGATLGGAAIGTLAGPGGTAAGAAGGAAAGKAATS